MKYYSIILLSFFLSSTKAFIICGYMNNPQMATQQLLDVQCDIIVHTNGFATSTDFTVSSFITVGTEGLRDYNCRSNKTPIYFGLHPYYIDFKYESKYLLSVEKAINWTKASAYAGVYMDLYSVDGTNQETASRIMSKVKSMTAALGLGYGFQILGKPDGFRMMDHSSSANFISVSSKQLVSGQSAWADYLDTLNVTAIAQYWSSKGANVSRLVFTMLPFIFQKNVGDNAATNMVATSCREGNRTSVVNWMWENTTTIANMIKSSQMKGVYLEKIDWDDISGSGCLNGSSPLTTALRTKLNR